MKRGMYLILAIVISLMLLDLGISFAQESGVSSQTSTEAQAKAETQVVSPKSEEVEAETLWLWGEVISVDTHNKSLRIKYLDYETEVEKEISINTDDKTTYEGVKSIGEIKPKDTVSVDYIVNADGKNVAKNIVIEKPEVEPLPKEETEVAP